MCGKKLFISIRGAFCDDALYKLTFTFTFTFTFEKQYGVHDSASCDFYARESGRVAKFGLACNSALASEHTQL